MSLAEVTLGVAIAEANWKVREEGGNNRGPRIAEYLRNVDPPISIPAPWCAAFVQSCSDLAAQALAVDNPLDAVRLEALVQSYVNWSEETSRQTLEPRPGDLVCFKFGSSGRWNHIGIVARAPDRAGMLWVAEGNTGDVDQRDGDGVYLKPRFLSRQPTYFIRW